VAPKRKHTRANPQSPLATPEPDPEKIIRKGKALQGASSCKFSGIFGDLLDYVFHTPVFVSNVSHLPITENRVSSTIYGYTRYGI
jgi:hypothetical protein